LGRHVFERDRLDQPGGLGVLRGKADNAPDLGLLDQLTAGKAPASVQEDAHAKANREVRRELVDAPVAGAEEFLLGPADADVRVTCARAERKV
jgi:hypothetical protein